jgi:hypothetical protein
MSGKVLVYDGDCPICIRGSERFVRWGLVPEERRREFQSYEGEPAERLAAAGFRNEMAVFEPASGEIRTGIPGFLWLLRDGRFGPLARLLDRPLFVASLTGVYHLVSYNRRILAPPRSAVRCACDPDDRPGYQIALLVLLLVFTLGVGALLGAAVAAGSGMAPPRAGALRGLLAAGAGWAALAVAALVAVPGDVRLRFLAHLAVVAAIGAAVLLPATLLAPFLRGASLWIVIALSAAASLWAMAGQLPLRLRYLGLWPRRRPA